MKHMIRIMAVAVLLCVTVRPASAQIWFSDVLQEIEANNQSLAAKRKLVNAEIMEAKTGNSLEDPEVEYAHTWGHPSSLGKSGELTVAQSFDFPTLYAHRNKLAKLKIEQYDYEYAAYRQEVLLEAQAICVDITALRQKDACLQQALGNAEKIMKLVEQKHTIGDVSTLDVNKARFECANAMNACRMNQVELASAEKRLVSLNGGKHVSLPDEIPADLCAIPSYEMVMESYEASSPELQAMMSELAVAGQEIKVSKGQSLPKLKLGYRNDFSKGERFNGVVVGMSIPMFGNKNKVKSAKARNAYAEAEVKRAKTDMEGVIAELFAKESVLRSTAEEYEALAEMDNTVGLLTRSLEAGHITLVDYFSQVQPVYEANIAVAEVWKELRTVCAAINMIYLQY